MPVVRVVDVVLTTGGTGFTERDDELRDEADVERAPRVPGALERAGVGQLVVNLQEDGGVFFLLGKDLSDLEAMAFSVEGDDVLRAGLAAVHEGYLDLLGHVADGNEDGLLITAQRPQGLQPGPHFLAF